MSKTDKCPKCEKVIVKKTHVGLGPFCSKRCQNAELNSWLTGQYVIPCSALENDYSDMHEEEGGV
jgi:uncharacterized protein